MKHLKYLFLIIVLTGVASGIGYLNGSLDWLMASISGPGFVSTYDYERENRGLAKVYNHNGENMVMTEIVARSSRNNADKACASIIGANGQPMVCKNNVESFPYLGNQACKLFHPNANERVSTFPGHGAHGGHYDIFCSFLRTIGITGTCSQITADTCTTCPSCAKNLSCNEIIDEFSNAAYTRCYERQLTLAESMILRMDFDNSTSFTFDSSGEGNHGVNHGVVQETSACRKGNCAKFDGANDFIDARNVYRIHGDGTVALWVKAGQQEGAGKRVIDLQQARGTGINIYFDNGRIVLDNGGGPSRVLPTNPGYEDGQWHHVAVSRTGNDYTMYVDGAYVGKVTGTKPTYTGYTIGKWTQAQNFFDGNIDELYVFSKALTPSEIQTVMTQGVAAQADSSSGSGGQASAVEEAPPVPEPPMNPIASTATVNGSTIALVTKGQSGTEACRAQGLACLGYANMNRDACLALFPGAKTKNENQGGQRDFFCQSGSNTTTEPCKDTYAPTCATCASCEVMDDCNEPLTNADAIFAECVEPFSPEVIELGIPYQGDLIYDATNGTITGQLTVTHPFNEPTEAKFEVSSDTGETFSAAIIASAEVDLGDVNLVDQEYQVQSIDTDQYEAIVLTFVWNASEQGFNSGDEYILKVSIRDETGNVSFQSTDINTIPEESTYESAPGITTGPSGAGDADTDGDGIPNNQDDDIDGDGISNAIDTDIDGDGIENGQDDDVDGDNIPNGQDRDVDGDGTTNESDGDIDGDGINNRDDDDVDGDGVLNGDDGDVDGDGIENGEDEDIDGDGIQNGEDGDVDGDGVANTEDGDIDGDGILNERDADQDGDGIANEQDTNPTGAGNRSGVSQETIIISQQRIIDCFEITEQAGTPCTQEEITQLLSTIENNQFLGEEAELEKAQFIQDYLNDGTSGMDAEEKKALFGLDMTRGEALELIVFLLRKRGVVDEALISDGRQTYTDVSPRHDFYQAVEIGTALGIVEGYRDGTFGVNKKPNVAETARIVTITMTVLSEDAKRVLDEESTIEFKTGEEWFQKYIDTLARFGVFTFKNMLSTVSGIELVDLLQDFAKGAGIQNPLSDL